MKKVLISLLIIASLVTCGVIYYEKNYDSNLVKVDDIKTDPKFEKVALYLIRECDDNGKVEIGSDWDNGDGDYPTYLQFTKSED